MTIEQKIKQLETYLKFITCKNEILVTKDRIKLLKEKLKNGQNTI